MPKALGGGERSTVSAAEVFEQVFELRNEVSQALIILIHKLIQSERNYILDLLSAAIEQDCNEHATFYSELLLALLKGEPLSPLREKAQTITSPLSVSEHSVRNAAYSGNAAHFILRVAQETSPTSSLSGQDVGALLAILYPGESGAAAQPATIPARSADVHTDYGEDNARIATAANHWLQRHRVVRSKTGGEKYITIAELSQATKNANPSIIRNSIKRLDIETVKIEEVEIPERLHKKTKFLIREFDAHRILVDLLKNPDTSRLLDIDVQ
jgi:hypothetical protein